MKRKIHTTMLFIYLLMVVLSACMTSEAGAFAKDTLVTDRQPFLEGTPDMVCADSGNCYLAVEDTTTDNDCLDVYRSMDGGSNWAFMVGLGFCGTIPNDYTDPVLAVPELTEDFLYLVYVEESTKKLMLLKVSLTDSSSSFHEIDSNPTSGISRPRIVSDDRDYSPLYYLYVSYASGGQVTTARSSDMGITWSNKTTHGSSSIPFSDIAYANATLYVTWQYTSIFPTAVDDIYVSRSTNFGLGWDAPVQLEGAPQAGIRPRITGIEWGDDVVVAYTKDYVTDTDVWFSYSTDGGATWVNDQALAYEIGTNEGWPEVTSDSGKFYIAYWQDHHIYQRNSLGPPAWDWIFSDPSPVNDTHQAIKEFTPPALAAYVPNESAAVAWSDGRTIDNAIYFDMSDRVPESVVRVEPLTIDFVQGSEFQWERTFGGAEEDLGFSVVQTVDGGYAIAGTTRSFIGAYDYYLIKTDPDGNKLWEKTFDGNLSDNWPSIIEMSDGDLVLGGNSFGAGNVGMHVFRTDGDGNLRPGWKNGKTIGGGEWAEAWDADKTDDGGLVFVGSSDASVTGSIDVYMFRTDGEGNLLSGWESGKTFGGAGLDEAHSVQETSDGGFIISGNTSSFGMGFFDIYLLRTDANGNPLPGWGSGKTFGGLLNEDAFSVKETSDGGFVIAGLTESFGMGSYDVYLLRTDGGGNLLSGWESGKTFGGSGPDRARSVQETGDGGFVIAGETYSFNGSTFSDVYLVKTGPAGNLVWQKTFGGSGSDSGWAVIETMYGGYVIAGDTGSNPASGQNVYMIHYNPSDDNRYFVIYNDGSAPLEITSLTKRDGELWYDFIAPSTPFTIAPGKWQVVTVTVDWDLVPDGMNSDRILVASNDTDLSPYPGGVIINANRPALTVTRTGAGSGTVTTNPTGISCDPTCQFHFWEGETVILYAEPDPGSVFTGWGGHADCRDGRVTMNNNRDCIATFAPFVEGLRIRVSQESAPGQGDFEDHVLGFIDPYPRVSDTAAVVYNYYTSQYNGSPPFAVEDTTQLFFTDTSEGLMLFTVHDIPDDDDGGRAQMRFEIFDDPDGAARVVEDDNVDTDRPGNTFGPDVMDVHNAWAPLRTDGVVIGSLDGGAWTLHAQFADIDGIADNEMTGLTSLIVSSAGGAPIPLALETGRRVRLDIRSDNCPGVHNPDQADSDGDGVGDACDLCAGTPAGVPVDDTGCPISIVIPGDCNGDTLVDAGDLTATVLEIFDGDGSVPADAPGGTFAGTAGCDANEDNVIDAGDLTCTVLTIFNGPGACGAN